MASGFATMISQAVLLALSLALVPAVVASTSAFVAGAVPHFLIVRRWARGGLPRQLTVYVAVTLAGGLTSITMVALTDGLITPLLSDPQLRTATLNLGYLIGGIPIFLAKFAALDRIFFTQSPNNQHSQPKTPNPGPQKSKWATESRSAS